MKRFPPVDRQFPHILHGADYNPEQWIATPEIWDEDMRLMKLAHINSASVGIFSWAALEPEEGVYRFEWLDTIMDKLAENGIRAVLATPSAARPAWMAEKYPEVLKVEENGQRIEFSIRQNHCCSSPVYRQKVEQINRKLAERYKDHPALAMWHVSNEYSSECHCELCQANFREWLKAKYGTLEALNAAWWTAFWSHTYTDWDQIRSPKLRGEHLVPALKLDWRRFTSDQNISFFRHEIAPLKEITPHIPVTTNLMETYPLINYQKLAKYMDVISWDNYPDWHNGPEEETACRTAFLHDIYRSLKGGKPFLMMESAPSCINWRSVNKLQRPYMQQLSALQAVAHGSDSVQYFQWRKSRGGHEKFHGAVVDHCGHEHTRVFRDVARLGAYLEKLDDVVGTTVQAEVAIVYDWENKWATDFYCGYNNARRDYQQLCEQYHAPFWKQGIATDIISMEDDFSPYKLVIAPMLYMLKPGTAERIKNYVNNGGTFVATYLTGVVDENDLCFLGGFPGDGLQEVFGIWAEETDSLYEHDVNYVEYQGRRYEVRHICDLIHSRRAEVLGRYVTDFYAGYPAVTRNPYGQGQAYYVAFRNDGDFCDDFCNHLIAQIQPARAIDTVLPKGVSAQKRGDCVFLMNFRKEPQQVALPRPYHDLLSEADYRNSLLLPGFGCAVLRETE